MAGVWTKAIITRCALATPLGASLDETWAALLAGRAITTHARVPLGRTEDRGRAGMLARHVVRQLQLEQLQGDTPLIVGTSKGAMEDWIAPLPRMASRAYIAGGLELSGLGGIAADLAHELKLRGPRLTISAACASGLIALVRAAMLIEAGAASRAIVVATESSLHPLFLGTFSRLGVLARDGEMCRPFDQNRRGFLVSEAAAAVCLEAAPADAPGVAIDRYAFGGDATHITASDPDARVLRSLLSRVIGGGMPDLVHAHGTATESNDPSELAAIESVIGSAAHSPTLYSHKGALGHSLGASGLVSIALNWMSHRTGVVLPNVQTESPLDARAVKIDRSPVRRSIRQSVAMAAGFGGATAVVSLRSASAG